MSTYESFTDFDCNQNYCIDKAEGRCNDGWDCCTCICDDPRYPYADQVKKKCVAFRETSTTSKATTLFSSTGKDVEINTRVGAMTFRP